jgi:opacity protein-like surface antigen
MVLAASTASAQRVEVSGSIGYTASEGISFDDRELLGALYDEVALKSGTSFTFTFGAFVNEQVEIEFLWSRQDSQLDAEGAGGTLPVSELAINNYHGNFVYNWGEADTRVRPFVFAGLGATQYSFGSLLLPNAVGDIGGNTQFSGTLGGGVKFYFAPNVGVKVMGRFTPTYIKSDPAGIWCDPFYGCWEVAEAKYANQFDISGGITIRF